MLPTQLLFVQSCLRRLLRSGITAKMGARKIWALVASAALVMSQETYEEVPQLNQAGLTILSYNDLTST